MPQSAQSYVDTDVREVFETHSIEQTQIVQKKINFEIERKREDLRMLVGERYRDLIDAADTIATMRTSSSSIFQKLTALRTTFNGLSTKLTVASSTVDGVSDHQAKKNLSQEELEISFALKLSLDIPSAIQNYLEKQEVIPALHLTILLTRWLKRNEDKYKWTFLGSTADNSVNVTLGNVCDFCDSHLYAAETSYQGLAECMLAEHILTSTSIDMILSHWLSRKIAACRQALSQQDSELLNVVTTTLEAIHSIFFDANLYGFTAKRITEFQLEPSIFGFRFTPKVIMEYNQNILPITEPPSIKVLTEIIINDFITPLIHVLEGDTSYMLQFGTLVQLQEYRQTSQKLIRERCEDFMRVVLGPSSSLWIHVFHPVFQKRAEAIASQAVGDIMNFLRTAGYPKFRAAEANFDLMGFVWQLSKTNSAVTNTDGSGSSTTYDNLKMKCLTPCVSQLCEDLEFRWSELVVDFQALGDQNLKEFISTTVLESMKTFLQKTLESEEDSLKDSKADLAKSFSSFGRFAIGLIELCPTLWKLLGQNDAVQFKHDLIILSEQHWEKWSLILMETFAEELVRRMGSLESEVVPSFMPMGEVCESSSGENGEKFVPSVRVPVVLTNSLHSLLFSISMEMAKVGPQCIPKPVKDSLRINLAEKIITAYEIISGSNLFITPQMALQFTFDLKFIQWFHSCLRGKADVVTLKLKSLIDPFDWDIVNTRMTSNLKRFLFENQLTLGLLFSEESHGFITQNFKTKQSLTFPAPIKHLLYNQLPLLPL